MNVLPRIAALALVLAMVVVVVGPVLPGGQSTEADMQGTSGSDCIADVGGTNCTAEDVDIGKYTVISGPDS